MIIFQYKGLISKQEIKREKRPAVLPALLVTNYADKHRVSILLPSMRVDPKALVTDEEPSLPLLTSPQYK